MPDRFPIGAWIKDLALEETHGRDQYNLYHTPKIYDLEQFALNNGRIALLESPRNA